MEKGINYGLPLLQWALCGDGNVSPWRCRRRLGRRRPKIAINNIHLILFGYFILNTALFALRRSSECSSSSAGCLPTSWQYLWTDHLSLACTAPQKYLARMHTHTTNHISRYFMTVRECFFLFFFLCWCKCGRDGNLPFLCAQKWTICAELYIVANKLTKILRPKLASVRMSK